MFTAMSRISRLWLRWKKRKGERMAWLEIHQGLREHRKVYACADLLGLSRVAMIGTMVCLWLWALDNAPDGNLTQVSAKTIANVCGYPQKKAARLLEALISVGFLDRNEGELVIHDWAEYAGRLMERREKDRDRKRKKTGSAPRNSGGIPAEILRNSGATVQYSTEQCSTVLTIEENSGNDAPAPTAASAPPGGNASAGFDGQSFSKFWEAYPADHRMKRESVYAAWRRLAPSRETAAQILASLEKWKLCRRWIQDNGEYIPNAVNFLTQEYWKIQPPSDQTKKAVPKGASGELGGAELEAIRRVLAEPTEDGVC